MIIVDLVEIILEFGANVNAKNIEGYTPLHLAVAKGYKEIAWVLLNHGAIN
ncbi:MAG: ankyrin repeat domain-containing protein [Clostridiales bacterium]|nr:ankyrin repeat domain-containing protein [Clostridiales bacterium]